MQQPVPQAPQVKSAAVPAGINLNDPGTRQFFTELGLAIAKAQPQQASQGATEQVSMYEKPGVTARMRTIEGAKNYRKSARSQTRRKLLMEPHTTLFISMTSPLLPKDTQNAAHNKELAVWSPSINLVNYTIPAEKQIRVPLTLYKQYTLALLSKTKGLSGYQEYQKTQRLIATDKFYSDRGLMMFDFLGEPWGTSRINPESTNYDEAYSSNEKSLKKILKNSWPGVEPGPSR